MTKILVVDDDPEVTRLLETYLSGEGFAVRVVADGAGAVAATALEEPDLVLLDIVLGEEDGRDVLRELRLVSDVPVDLPHRPRPRDPSGSPDSSSARTTTSSSPSRLPEVTARIETVLRRAGANLSAHQIEVPTLRFGELLINENTHEVRLDGELVELTTKEFALLAFLARSPRQVFSREQLLEHVWESSPEWQNQATVTEHVRRLRAKIEGDPDHPRWITTVRGVGYRFEPEST